jgi:hypothetical protein
VRVGTDIRALELALALPSIPALLRAQVLVVWPLVGAGTARGQVQALVQVGLAAIVDGVAIEALVVATTYAVRILEVLIGAVLVCFGRAYIGARA